MLCVVRCLVFVVWLLLIAACSVLFVVGARCVLFVVCCAVCCVCDVLCVVC